MAKSATQLARDLLEGDDDGLEELRIHEFEDDESTHADEMVEKLCAEFVAEFERVRAELSKRYGPPSRSGSEDDEVIPLSGVFRFSVWEVGERLLFAAAAHEDRGVPILLMLGTTAGDGG
jgi:hypothetical protein